MTSFPNQPRTVRLCILCFALLGVTGAPFAAESGRTVRVSGLVSNQVTGDLLAGALIGVEGTHTTTTTERGGAYSLSLPDGTHTLLVSFSGLDPARVTVTVSAGTPV